MTATKFSTILCDVKYPHADCYKNMTDRERAAKARELITFYAENDGPWFKLLAHLLQLHRTWQNHKGYDANYPYDRTPEADEPISKEELDAVWAWLNGEPKDDSGKPDIEALAADINDDAKPPSDAMLAAFSRKDRNESAKQEVVEAKKQYDAARDKLCDALMDSSFAMLCGAVTKEEWSDLYEFASAFADVRQ